MKTNLFRRMFQRPTHRSVVVESMRISFACMVGFACTTSFAQPITLKLTVEELDVESSLEFNPKFPLQQDSDNDTSEDNTVELQSLVQDGTLLRDGARSAARASLPALTANAQFNVTGLVPTGSARSVSKMELFVFNQSKISPFRRPLDFPTSILLHC